MPKDCWLVRKGPRASLRFQMCRRLCCGIAWNFGLCTLAECNTIYFCIERAVLIFIDGPLHVVGNEEIEFAVVVVVKPHRAGGKSRVAHAAFGGDIGEFAVPQIVKQMIRPTAVM